jgi:hypothetical protein
LVTLAGLPSMNASTLSMLVTSPRSDDSAVFQALDGVSTTLGNCRSA